jgi:hypothetical protein
VDTGCQVFFLGRKGAGLPAGSWAASFHHIPGWQDATQRAKLGIVAAGTLNMANLRPLRLMAGLALMANTSLLGAGVAPDARLGAHSGGVIQVSAPGFTPYYGLDRIGRTLFWWPCLPSGGG